MGRTFADTQNPTREEDDDSDISIPNHDFSPLASKHLLRSTRHFNDKDHLSNAAKVASQVLPNPRLSNHHTGRIPANINTRNSSVKVSRKRSKSSRKRLSASEDTLEPKRKTHKHTRGFSLLRHNQHDLSPVHANAISSSPGARPRSASSELDHCQMEIDSPMVHPLRVQTSLSKDSVTAEATSDPDLDMCDDSFGSTPSRNPSWPSSEFITPISHPHSPLDEEDSSVQSPDYITMNEAFIPPSVALEDPFLDDGLYGDGSGMAKMKEDA